MLYSTQTVYQTTRSTRTGPVYWLLVLYWWEAHLRQSRHGRVTAWPASSRLLVIVIIVIMTVNVIVTQRHWQTVYQTTRSTWIGPVYWLLVLYWWEAHLRQSRHGRVTARPASSRLLVIVIIVIMTVNVTVTQRRRQTVHKAGEHRLTHARVNGKCRRITCQLNTRNGLNIRPPLHRSFTPRHLLQQS